MDFLGKILLSLSCKSGFRRKKKLLTPNLSKGLPSFLWFLTEGSWFCSSHKHLF